MNTNVTFRPTRHERPEILTNRQKIAVTVEKYGVDETLDIVNAIGPFGSFVIAIVTRGWKIWAIPGYMWMLIKAFIAVQKAIVGIEKIPKEINDLNDEEIQKLLSEGGDIVPLLIAIWRRKQSKGG